MEVLAEHDWRARQDAHRERVQRWTEPYRRRKQQKREHPVHDFLWTYYSFRPARLERWQPRLDVALEGGAEFLERTGFARSAAGVALDPAGLTPKRLDMAKFVRGLLSATAQRAPRLGCFGLHEWAMLYRTRQQDVRHAGWPLRLGHEGTDQVVESMPMRCTHHDAFRFFTAPARPLNEVHPTREDQADQEQPGCLHANMDLAKLSHPARAASRCWHLSTEPFPLGFSLRG